MYIDIYIYNFALYDICAERNTFILECSTAHRSPKDYADWVIDQIDPDRWETQPWEFA